MKSRNRAQQGLSVIAAVDVGSNSVKMTVARLSATGAIEILTEASDAVRLGAGSAVTGLLAEDRIAAAIATLHRFAATAGSFGAESLVGVATEAVRRAANGTAFLDRVRRETGWDVRLLSGDDEAALTFRGLASVMDMPGNVVVADIGGASTEVIRASARTITSAVSLRLGSGSLTDAFITADPPTVAELDSCRASAHQTLAQVDFSGTAAESLVITGGTGVYLAMLVTDPVTITPDAVDIALQRASTVNAARLAGRLGIAEARARVLPAGITIVQTLISLVRPTRIDTAQSGIRMGLIVEHLLPTGSSVG
jgi:exopolyphosphatase/guanosine-5'-triphosphate,3'-diphosphate pyrophosphatase